MKRLLLSSAIFMSLFCKGQIKDFSFTTKGYCSTNTVQPYDVGYSRRSTVTKIGDTIRIISFDENRPPTVRSYTIYYSTKEESAPYINIYECDNLVKIKVYQSAKWAMVIDDQYRSMFTMLFHNYNLCK